MTVQEAISILIRMQEPEAWEQQITVAGYTALDMAISALRNKETKNVTEKCYNPCLTCSQIGNTFCDCSKK